MPPSRTSLGPTVAFVQDHLVQRGGAERVLLSMVKAAPDAEVITPIYEPDLCDPALTSLGIRTSVLNRSSWVRRHHRATLPALPLVMSAMRVDADVTVCATSGWAQGVRASGRKVLYFHAVPRWIHEREAYLKGAGSGRRLAASVLAPPLGWWDQRTVRTGHRFLTQGTVMRERLQTLYGVDAEVLPPPNRLGADGPQRAVPGLDAGFFFCASRLLPYKNVDVLVEAFTRSPAARLVVAGDGPMLQQLQAVRPPNVELIGSADDEQLRWLYARCTAVVSAAVEPFGLTPIEGAAFGRPTIAPDAGGFVDTVVDGETGVRYAPTDPAAVVAALARFSATTFDASRIQAHAAKYDEAAFVARLREVIEEEARAG